MTSQNFPTNRHGLQNESELSGIRHSFECYYYYYSGYNNNNYDREKRKYFRYDFLLCENIIQEIFSPKMLKLP